MLNALVDLLSKDTMALGATLTRLAERHNKYGIKPVNANIQLCLPWSLLHAQQEHYDPFGQAFVIMLRAGLGEDFTPETCAGSTRLRHSGSPTIHDGW